MNIPYGAIMPHRSLQIFYLLLTFAAQASPVDKRVWTDVQGRTMEAQFVREVDGDATFLKGGKLVTMPLDRLCEKDQKLIRELEVSKKVEQDQPPAGALTRDLDPAADGNAATTK